MKVMQFQGMKHRASSPISLPPVTHLDLTPSPEVPLTILKRKLLRTNDMKQSQNLIGQIQQLLDARHVIEKSVHKIVSLLAGFGETAESHLSERAMLTAHDCYQEAVTHFRTHCFNWHSVTVSPARILRSPTSEIVVLNSGALACTGRVYLSPGELDAEFMVTSLVCQSRR